MSSDGVRGVDDAVSCCPLPKKAAHGPVWVWWCAPMCRVVWCGIRWVWACFVAWWCGGCKEKSEKRKDTVKQKQKGLFLPLFHHHSLLIHTLTCFFILHTRVHSCWTKKHQWHNIWFISLSFLLVQTLFFSSFSFIGRLNADAITIHFYIIIK